MEKVTDLTARLAAPIVEEQGCSLWDVEYVKEAGTWYLRVLIDKEGGVDILDCEAISRQLSDLLDEADPIEGSYTLEVGSAGITSPFKVLRQYVKNIGNEVEMLLKNGSKLTGVLKSADENGVVVSVEKKVKPEGAKRKVTVVEDESYTFDEIKYTKYLIRFK